MEGIDRMDCPAGMGEAPWKVTGGSNDDGDWGHFRVWTIVEAEHVNGESREHKLVDSPGHWSSCSPYMQMQTSLCPNSRVLPADISMSSQDSSGPPQNTCYKVVPPRNNTMMFGNCSMQ